MKPECLLTVVDYGISNTLKYYTAVGKKKDVSLKKIKKTPKQIKWRKTILLPYVPGFSPQTMYARLSADYLKM